MTHVHLCVLSKANKFYVYDLLAETNEVTAIDMDVVSHKGITKTFLVIVAIVDILQECLSL